MASRPGARGYDAELFMSRMMSAAMLQGDTGAAESVGLSVSSDGKLEFSTYMRHHDESPAFDIIDPATLKYKLVVCEEACDMKHRYVSVGMGALRSRLEAPAHPSLLASGEEVRARLEVDTADGKRVGVVFDGTWTVPAERHALGHPGGRPGYMIPVYERAVLFVFNHGEITWQGNLDDMELLGERV